MMGLLATLNSRLLQQQHVIKVLVFCSQVRHFTLTVSLLTQEYNGTSDCRYRSQMLQ